jgi:hypothetical protein
VPGGIQGDLNDDQSLMSADWRACRSQRLTDDSGDTKLLDSFQAAFRRYVVMTAKFKSLADRGQGQAAANVLGDGAGDDQWDTLKSLITAWNNYEVAGARAAAAVSRSGYEDGVTLIILLLAAAVTIAVVVAMILARRTTRAVREIGAAANLKRRHRPARGGAQ